MKDILDFLKEAEVFFLATTEGTQPRVRPMGFFMEYKGKLCFSTNNTKPMFAQMKANPNIEICAYSGGKWLRVAGKIAFNTEREARVAALEAMPSLGKMYNPDDGKFEIFHFESATAHFSDMQGNNREVKF
ncbi:NimC/NimA family protein [Spirochaetia bacterium]|nr:NimC/NimA family protein [Spirochaetia bacterium]